MVKVSHRVSVCRHCGSMFEYANLGKGTTRTLCSDECKRAKLREAKARYRAANRQKLGVYNRAWNKAHPDRVDAANARYRDTHREQHLASQQAYNNRRQTPAEAKAEYQRRRRAAKKSRLVGKITPALLAAKCAYWGNRCWACGTTERVELDHVKPLAKGGLHCLANIRPICRSCNATKSDRWPYPTSVRLPA